MKNEEIAKVVPSHPEGDINVCTTFSGNISDSCLYNSLKTMNDNLMVVLEEQSGESVGFIFWEP
jgi:hypothetical protein